MFRAHVIIPGVPQEAAGLRSGPACLQLHPPGADLRADLTKSTYPLSPPTRPLQECSTLAGRPCCHQRSPQDHMGHPHPPLSSQTQTGGGSGAKGRPADPAPPSSKSSSPTEAGGGRRGGSRIRNFFNGREVHRRGSE